MGGRDIGMRAVLCCAYFVILAAVTCSCSRQNAFPDGAVSAPNAWASEVSATDTQVPNIAPILEALFSEAFGTPPLAVRKAPEGGRESAFRVVPVAAIKFGTNYALISESSTDDCHGCFGRLSVHYFTAIGSKYKIAGSWPNLVTGNGWGKPPEWRLRHDLMRNPVLEVRTRFGNQGYNCEWVSLVELAYDRPIIRLPTIVAGYDNTGASDDGLGQSTTAVVDPQPGGGFVLRYLGSRPGHVSYVAGKRGYRPQGPQPLRECSG